MSKSYSLKITSGVVVNGVPVAAGRIVHDIDDAQARRLLGAGKAELATAADIAVPNDETGPDDQPADDDTDAAAKQPAKAGRRAASKEEGKP